ncbi:MAG: cytidyltransferase [Legionellales bacterium]|nr:cytidyltransferase [Legionellales bacterium]|tara:strand:- start:2260 stop:2970 length:711 start_codon:yes stop_codon:yes gene_type:complete
MSLPNILAIIPARGGSKSIPDKNLVELAGKPLIAHSIISAQETPTISRVLVTTDSAKIRDVSINYHAEVPFMRPANLSEDDTPDLPVFQHCLEWLQQNESYSPDLIVHLRPTTPFRDVCVIDECINKMLENKKADSLRVVTISREHPYKMWTLNGDFEYLEPLISSDIHEPYNQPRQSLPVSYFQPGYLDVIRPNTITHLESMSGSKIMGHIIQSSNIVDIDDQLSLDFSRFIHDK